jgi:hypothetical protein
MSRLATIILLVAALLCGALQAEDAVPERAESLVARLGSTDWAERERATRALIELGEPARDALRAALSAEDAEVRTRASRALIEIGEDLVYALGYASEDDPVLADHGLRAVSALLGLDSGGILRELTAQELRGTGTQSRQVVNFNQPPELALLRVEAMTGYSFVIGPSAEEHWQRILSQPQMSGGLPGDLSQMIRVRSTLHSTLNGLLGNPTSPEDSVALHPMRVGQEEFFFITNGAFSRDIARECREVLVRNLCGGPKQTQAASLLAVPARGNARARQRIREAAPKVEGARWLSIALEQELDLEPLPAERLWELLRARDWRAVTLLAQEVSRQAPENVRAALSPVVAEGSDALAVALALWMLHGHDLDGAARDRAYRLLHSRQDMLAAAAVRWMSGAGELPDAALEAFWEVCDTHVLGSEFFREAEALLERADVRERLEVAAREAIAGASATRQAMATLILRGNVTQAELLEVLKRVEAVRGNDALLAYLETLFEGVAELPEEGIELLVAGLARDDISVRRAFIRLLSWLDPALVLRIAAAALERITPDEGETERVSARLARIEINGLMAGAGDSAALTHVMKAFEDENVEIVRAAGRALVDAAPGDSFFDVAERVRDEHQSPILGEGLLQAYFHKCERAAAAGDVTTFRRAFQHAQSFQIPTMWQLRTRLFALQAGLQARAEGERSALLPARIELRRLEVDVE